MRHVLLVSALAVGALLTIGCARSGERFIGIDMDTIPKGVVMRDHLDPRVGVWVGTVRPGEPADRAGIMPGDVILRVDGTAIRSMAQFHAVVQHGGELHLTVLRAGALREVTCPEGIIAVRAGDYREAYEATERQQAYATYPRKDELRDWSGPTGDAANLVGTAASR